MTDLSLHEPSAPLHLPPATTLGHALALQAQAHGSHDALVYACQGAHPDVRYSYRELHLLADAIAADFLAYGLKPGDRVAVWGSNDYRWVLVQFALARAGLVLVGLNPLYKASELEFALRASRTKAIVSARRIKDHDCGATLDRIGPYLEDLEIRIFFDEIRDCAPAHPVSFSAPVKPRGSDLLMIQFTSGTTGTPKAVALTQQGVCMMAFQSYLHWGVEAGDRVCHGFPLFHVGGAGNSTPGAILNGATTLPLYIFNAAETLHLLEKERCTCFIGVPTMLTRMMSEPHFSSTDLSALKNIVIGGAPVPESLLKQCEERFGVPVINSYGQTETSGVITTALESDSATLKSTTSGRALPGVSLKVVNDNGETLPRGEIGELRYRGPGNMAGYENAPPGEGFDAAGWLCTGDLAKMDPGGYVTIVGRQKELIIRGGENLSPVEIESYLLTHPAVAQVAVIGVPDEVYGEEVCAVIRCEGHGALSPENIRGWCLERVSRWKVPRYFVFMDDLPMTPSGKVQKHKLNDIIIPLLDSSK